MPLVEKVQELLTPELWALTQEFCARYDVLY